MLVTQKRITRVAITLDDEERDCLYDTKRIADCFLAELELNNSNEMMCLATGEILERRDIEKFKGFISAMESPYWEIIK